MIFCQAAVDLPRLLTVCSPASSLVTFSTPSAGKNSGVAPNVVAHMVNTVESTAAEAGLEVLMWRKVRCM